MLDALLDKYTDNGLNSVESLDILGVDPLGPGSQTEIIIRFGNTLRYLAAIRHVESEHSGVGKVTSCSRHPVTKQSFFDLFFKKQFIVIELRYQLTDFESRHDRHRLRPSG